MKIIAAMSTMWTYRGVDVFRVDRPNSSGIRWYARTRNGILRADTKDGMRRLIRAQHTR